MPKGSKHRFTIKEDRQAKHISKGYQKKGYSKKESDAKGYATVQRLRKR